MSHLNDLQFQKLRALGYTGALPEMKRLYTTDNGIEDWYTFMGAAGYTQPQMSDRSYAYWDGLVVP